MSSSNPSPTTDLEPESRHGAIFEIAIDRVRPAVVNDQIYRPVDPDDPDVRSLARSIDAHGQLDEIVLTQDDVILSGHRRRVACELAGLRTVRARRFGGGGLARRMQRLESSVMIGGVAARLLDEHPDMPLLTVHDSILTPPEYVHLVQDVIASEWESKFGVVPQMKVSAFTAPQNPRRIRRC